MKKPLTVLFLLPLMALPPAFARAAGAASPDALTATAVSVKILGKSTLHGWQASALSATVTAQAVADKAGLADAVSHRGLLGLDLVVGVDSLKSTESSGMDKNMHKALDSDQFPDIRFSMKSYQLTGLTVTAQGDLEIHGVTKPVTLSATLSRGDKGITVQGSTPLLMSDYGVKPPVMMFGTIRVADQVTIVYGFHLGQ